MPVAASLHGAVTQLATRHGVCGVAVAIVRARKLQSVESAQGCADRAAPDPGSVFQAASLSKPLFAYAVLKLVEEGQIDLDAPVLKYLPNGYAHRFQPYRADSAVDIVTDPRLTRVTVRMLLNHTSGLPNWSDGPLRFDLPPGEGWRYSGEGYALLQSAVESISNEALDEFMARRVFAPLGMTHSAYTRQARLESFIVPSTATDGTSFEPVPLTLPVAAFTLHTSAQDYGRFLAALLADGPAIGQIVACPMPVNPKLELSWGLGWGLAREKGELFIWQWGNNPGYQAFAMASLRSGDGFVMLTASDRGLAMAEPLSNLILGGPRQVFRFHLLREGLALWLCEAIDICL